MKNGAMRYKKSAGVKKIQNIYLQIPLLQASVCWGGPLHAAQRFRLQQSPHWDNATQPEQGYTYFLIVYFFKK